MEGDEGKQQPRTVEVPEAQAGKVEEPGGQGGGAGTTHFSFTVEEEEKTTTGTDIRKKLEEEILINRPCIIEEGTIYFGCWSFFVYGILLANYIPGQSQIYICSIPVPPQKI